jgi:hypothetical protein
MFAMTLPDCGLDERDLSAGFDEFLSGRGAQALTNPSCQRQPGEFGRLIERLPLGRFKPHEHHLAL